MLIYQSSVFQSCSLHQHCTFSNSSKVLSNTPNSTRQLVRDSDLKSNVTECVRLVCIQQQGWEKLHQCRCSQPCYWRATALHHSDPILLQHLSNCSLTEFNSKAEPVFKSFLPSLLFHYHYTAFLQPLVSGTKTTDEVILPVDFCLILCLLLGHLLMKPCNNTLHCVGSWKDQGLLGSIWQKDFAAASA